MKLFSDNYKIFENIKLSFLVKAEDILTIRNGEVCLPETLEELKTIGVVSNVNNDDTIDILVRNRRKDKDTFDNDIKFWEKTLSELNLKNK